MKNYEMVQHPDFERAVAYFVAKEVEYFTRINFDFDLNGLEWHWEQKLLHFNTVDYDKLIKYGTNLLAY